MAAYQATQLAELDKKLALWDQRLQQLDQKIATTTKSVQDAITQLKTHLNTLISAMDGWLTQVAADASVTDDFRVSVKSLREKLATLYAALDGPITPEMVASIATLVTDLQGLSDALLKTLSEQADNFAHSLEQAATDLLNNYGVQI